MIKKILFVMFITIVSMYGQSNDDTYKELLDKAGTSVKAGEKDKAYYYITRYVALVLTDTSTSMKVGDISSTINLLGLKPISFISGKYSDDFLGWFFMSTYYMWAAPEQNTNEESLSSVVAQASYDDYYLCVIGHPVIESCSIIGSKNGKVSSSYLHLIDCNQPPRLVAGRTNNEDHKLISYDLKNQGLNYHFFWKPEFIDLDKDGRREIILRYNVARADGFYQECDVFQLKDTSIVFLDSLTGDPEGFAKHVSGNTFQTGEAFPGSQDTGHLGYDKYKIKNYEFVNGKFHETGNAETIDNILWSDSFKKYFLDE